MSSNLSWEPLTRKKHDISTDVKLAMRKYFRGEQLNKRVLSRAHISFLEGFVAAGIEDAQKLIDAIEKYDEIELSEEWR